MRPHRIFLFLVVVGSVCVVANLVRLFQADSTLASLSSVALIAVGAGCVWRGGYMLEWWGPPEPE